MTTLFHSDTDSVSQPNGLMCVHDDARQSTMCKCPQDNDYQTSSECPSNRHYSQDLSHASSMYGETNRQTATRERTNRSSKFPVSRVAISAVPARDAALSPPSSRRSTTGRRLLTGLQFMCHFTSVHLILQQRNTNCGRFTTCMRRVVVTSSRGPTTRGRFTIDPKIHQPAHLQTYRLPPVGGHLCCSPNTLTPRSPEAVPPTKLSFATWDSTISVQFQRSPAPCPSGH